MKDKQEYFLFFQNCILVKGIKFVSICDLQRNEIYKFDSSFYDIFNFPINYPPDDNLFKEILDNLISLELGFLTYTPHSFPKINNTWKSPEVLTNGIIELSKTNVSFMQSLSIQLERLLIRNLELRITEPIPFDQFKNVIDYLIKGPVRGIDIYFDFDNEELEFFESFYKMMKTTPRIQFVLVGSCKNLDNKPFEDKRLFFTNDKIVRNLFCGNIGTTLMSNNISTYSESLHHNSCLNRKISIDSEGNIKNCPSMSESFGNIRDTSLEDAIEKSGFKKYWDINKDKINVCKDCEYRYICTDCRAYVEDPEDILSKPLKCGYNPYIGEWSEWSTNPLKQKAIDFYGMREIVDELTELSPKVEI